MPEWDEDVAHFMRYWFAGLSEGLAEVDAPARSAVLRACGKACAQSYTAEVFRGAWQASDGLESFLALLSEKFPKSTYALTGPQTLRVRYADCACDLVRLGLVKNPLFCECSAQNLASNLEAALGVPVMVRMEGSLLHGDSNCSFMVFINGDLQYN